ncbi:MAG TPA: 2-dehydropantoate 2-reductase N-terminal domain-containing protein [Paenirhodobacter sp.]
MTRYIIIGAGAVGASLAAELHLAGVPYALVGRGAQIAHLKTRGLVYDRPSGPKRVPVVAFGQGEIALDPGDILLLAVKTQDAEAAAAHWATVPVRGGGVGADLPIVTLQNGLAAEAIVARRFDRVYAASILTPATYLETGRVSVQAAPQIASVVLGRFPTGRDTVSAQIVADLARANILAEERADMPRWKAAKLLHNVKNVLEIFAGDDAAVAQAAARIEAEARAVLHAAGYDPAQARERQVSLSGWRILRDPAVRGQQSTWQSFARGASSEVDYLNGEIALLGVLHGVPTPWNRAVQKLAARLAATGGAPGSLDIAELDAQPAETA